MSGENAPDRKGDKKMLKQLAVLAAPAALATFLSVLPLRADGPDEISFNLVANPKFSACLGNDPYNNPPTAKVTVSRGTANDVMLLELRNFIPGKAFDLFTIERSNLNAAGVLDPNFSGSFGLAWYQSDIHVGADGKAEAVVKSILLDGIFGFDADPVRGFQPSAPLVPPTHTFHVGFWFDSPQDVAACGFDPSKPTPFNSEHQAGPNAMISLPDAVTGQGPLLSQPSSSQVPFDGAKSNATVGSATGGAGSHFTPQLTHCSGGMCR
jgi:hypothetical protein